MSVSTLIDSQPEQLYTFLCHQSPFITQAWFHRSTSSNCKLMSLWSVRDPVSEKQRKFLRFFWQTQPGGNFDSSLSSIEDDCIYMSCSPSGRRMIKFFQSKDKTSTKRRLEVWNHSTLESTIHCSEKLHGTFYFDEWFGGVAWSPDEQKVLYVAEQPTDPTTSFFDTDCKPEQKKGEQFIRQVDFGETYTGKRLATLFVFDMSQIYRVEGIDKEMAVSDPQWSPDGRHIVFVGRYLESYPLGVKYCYNRPSVLLFAKLALSKDHAQLEDIQYLTNPREEPLDWCARSPRFHPSGDWIVYLSTPKVPQDVHNGTSILGLIQCKPWKRITLIDISHPHNKNDFPGLYLHALPNNPWQDAQTLVLDSIWNSQSVLLRVKNVSPNITDSSQVDIQRIDTCGDGKDRENIFVLDVHFNNILLNASNPLCSPCLYLLRLDEDRIQDRIQLTDALNLSSALDWIEPTDLPQSDNMPSYDETFQAFVVYPRPSYLGKKMSLICYPHGGPHSSHLIQFQLGVVFLALRGYAVLMVNFRGSLGRGQESLTSLVGKIGYQDVEECVVATKWALNIIPTLSSETLVGALGGSHGGFLSAHLACQYPSIYRVAVLRNPVTNIVSMHSSTDIRDWCFTEIGYSTWQNEDKIQSLMAYPEMLDRMWKHSPVSHIHNCQAPTLLLLGGSDRRVPPSQGIEWHQLLRSKQIPTKLLWYPDSDHSISDSPSNDDAWIHTLLWLEEYLSKINGESGI